VRLHLELGPGQVAPRDGIGAVFHEFHGGHNLPAQQDRDDATQQCGQQGCQPDRSQCDAVGPFQRTVVGGRAFHLRLCKGFDRGVEVLFRWQNLGLQDDARLVHLRRFAAFSQHLSLLLKQLDVADLGLQSLQMRDILL
jgi:hypothetical protein